MCVESLLGTSNLRYQEIIYSVQGGLRVRTSVQGNTLKYTTKFTRKKYFFNSKLESGDAQGGKNSAHDDGSPSHVIRQRKNFAFVEFQQVGSYLMDSTGSGQSLNTQSE